MAATYPCGQPGSSLLCVSLEVFARRLDGTTAGCSFILPPLRVPALTGRCLHTRRFGTLASPPPPVTGPALPHPLAIRLVNVSGVTLNLDSNSWTLWQSCNVVNPGKMFHSNSIGSPSILSKALYSGELLNHVQSVLRCTV